MPQNEFTGVWRDTALVTQAATGISVILWSLI
jgi:hypothetical protein